MDGIHLLGEWYGCPADKPEMVNADALRRACMRRGRPRRPHDRGRALPPVRAAGRDRRGHPRRVAPRDPHLARDGRGDDRRLRLQLHDRQHGQGRAGLPRPASAGSRRRARTSRRSSAAASDRRTRTRARTSRRGASCEQRRRGVAPAAGDLVPGAMTEYLTDDWGFFIRSARELERFRSPYQAVEVHDSVPFGRLFRLDGHFMTSERDEFFYHENLVHLPGLTHPAPERALIVGGGDGGSAEELLKYPIDEVGDAVRDRPRRGRHRAQAPRARAPRRARRPAARPAHRRRLRVRARVHRALRPRSSSTSPIRAGPRRCSTRRSSTARARRGSPRAAR